MPVFHRFYRLFPLFLLVIALAACAGPGRGPWTKSGGYGNPSAQTTDANAPYGAPVAAPAATAMTQQGTVKVAILLPLSGANAGVGQSMLQAAQLALFDLGYDNFELMPRDTGGSAGGASAAATAALADGAQLILGPLFADEVRAVKSATSGSGVNVIAFSTDWSLAGGNTFMMGFMPFGQVERIADYAAAHGVHKVVIAGGADLYSTTVARAFEQRAAQNGLQIAKNIADPSSYDAVFLPVAGNALAATLPRIANQNAQKLGTGLWDDPATAANPMLNGAWYAAPPPSSRAGFENRYKSTYGQSPVRIATLAYDATALAAVLSQNNAGPSMFSADKLTSANGFAGVDGILRFNKNGIAERGIAILQIRGGRAAEISPAATSFNR